MLYKDNKIEPWSALSTQCECADVSSKCPIKWNFLHCSQVWHLAPSHTFYQQKLNWLCTCVKRILPADLAGMVCIGHNGVNIGNLKLIPLYLFYDHGPGLWNDTTNQVLVDTLLDFLNCRGLGLIHMNVRRLEPKLDSIRIWVQQRNPDILLPTETCCLIKLRMMSMHLMVTIHIVNILNHKGGRCCYFCEKLFCYVCVGLCVSAKRIWIPSIK